MEKTNLKKKVRQLKVKQRLNQVVTQAILDLILSGTIKPGDRLPSELALSKEHSVSRTVIRESIKQLEAMGVITTIVGSGSYVRTMETKDFEPFFSIFLALSSNSLTILQFFELRCAIELYTVQLLAKRSDEVSLAPLIKIMDDVDLWIEEGKYELVKAAAVDFHMKLIETSGNQLFAALIKVFMKKTRQRIVQLPVSTKEINDFHSKSRDCIKAISEGNADEAYKVMRLYLRNARERVYATEFPG